MLIVMKMFNSRCIATKNGIFIKKKIGYNTLIKNTKKPTKIIIFLILSFKKNL